MVKNLKDKFGPVFLHTLPNALFGVSVILAIFAVSHLFVLEQQSAVTISLVQGMAALVCLGLAVYLSSQRVPPRFAYGIGAGAALIVLFGILVHMWLIPEARLTTNLILFLLATGFLFLQPGWFVMITLMVWLGWGGTAWTAGPDQVWMHFGFALLAGTGIAWIVHFVRRNDVLKLHEMQVKLEERVEERTQELTRANETLRHESHERKKIANQLDLLSTALSAAVNAVMITDDEAHILWVNPAFTELTGYEEAEVLGKTPSLLKSGKHDPEFYRKLWETVREGKEWRGEMVNRRKSGELYTEEMTITPVKNSANHIAYYIAIKQELPDEEYVEGPLRESDRHYRNLFTNMQLGLFRTSPEGKILLANPQLAKLLQFDTAEELLGMGIREFFSPRNRLESLIATLQEQNSLKNFQTKLIGRDGTEIYTRIYVHALREPDGSIRYYEGTVEDITPQKNLEAQLLQAQKMEAVGHLAGGVAHDFNNLVTVIKGYSRLLLSEVEFDEDHPFYESLQQIDSAAERAETLARQLLTFSRQKATERKINNLNEVIENLDKMLHRLIEEDIELVLDLDPKLGNVQADAGQIEQVVMNMAVNARDAMPDGGTFTIQTREISGEEIHGMSFPLSPDERFVEINLIDTGLGMNQQTQERIFEPFFTTKEQGKGTGLGLATVRGIVEENEGHITVDSVPDQGTSFHIYFPVSRETQQSEGPQKMEVGQMRGTEKVLVVEDEQELRKLVSDVLKMYGYEVMDAVHGGQAVHLTKQLEEPIDLLVTDVIMPEMNGKELANYLTNKFKGIKVLYMSGHTDGVISQYDIFEKGNYFLAKPFTPTDLLQKVRIVLDETA